MPKVFISQENSTIDYSEAIKFGDIEFVTDLEFSLVDASLKNVRIFERLDYLKSAFNPEEDFLVMTGSPVTFGLCFHQLALKSVDLQVPLRILVWDRRSREYRVVTLSPDQLI